MCWISSRRAGVPVIVLEKHRDFLRDFRGDTIHPSTLELMYELGLLDEFLKRPHKSCVNLPARLETRCSRSRLHSSCDSLQVSRAHAAMGFF